jgi:hypothetical protein
MSRRFSVLITLLAQAMLLLSPTCFVQCVGADGHRCLELAGQSCHCCEARMSDHDHEHESTGCPHAAGTCCHYEQTSELPADDLLPNWVQDDCGCLHSRVPVASGVPVKNSAQTIDVNWLSSVALSAWIMPAVVVRAERGLQVNLLRPLPDPHLVALATSVLRV